MIFVKNSEQIRLMKKAGRITGEALALAGEMVREGVTTKQLDDCIRRHIESCGARPSFLGYGGFPGSACISINDEVIHGIPSAKRVLKEGDIVKIDVGAFIGGYHGDSANTFPVGRVSEEALRLIEATKRSFDLLLVIAGVVVAVLPGNVVALCADTTMRCNVIMLPFARIAGACMSVAALACELTVDHEIPTGRKRRR
jgi:methionine aminopeptidase type I